MKNLVKAMSEVKEIEMIDDILIHINGIPFTLKKGSIISGLEENYILAMEYDEQPKVGESLNKGE